MLRCLLLGLACLTVAASADAQTRLAWKFQKGQVLYLEEDLDIKQKMTVAGQQIDQDSSQTTLSKITVTNTSADGSVDLEMRFESIRSRGAMHDAKLNKRMEGATFQISLDRNYKITQFSGYDALVKRIAEGNAAMERIFRSVMSEDTFKTLIRQTFSVVPDGPVSRGDKWTRNLNYSLGPMGKVSVKRIFEYMGKGKYAGKSLDKLDVRGTGTYVPPKPGATALPFEIADAKLNFDSIKGSAYFDGDAGRLAEVEVNLGMSGFLTIKTGDEEVTVKLSQAINGRIRVLDRKP